MFIHCLVFGWVTISWLVQRSQKQYEIFISDHLGWDAQAFGLKSVVRVPPCSYMYDTRLPPQFKNNNPIRQKKKVRILQESYKILKKYIILKDEHFFLFHCKMIKIHFKGSNYPSLQHSGFHLTHSHLQI